MLLVFWKANETRIPNSEASAEPGLTRFVPFQVLIEQKG